MAKADDGIKELQRRLGRLARLGGALPAWRDALRFYLGAAARNRALLGDLLWFAAAHPGRPIAPTLASNQAWLTRAAAPLGLHGACPTSATPAAASSPLDSARGHKDLATVAAAVLEPYVHRRCLTDLLAQMLPPAGPPAPVMPPPLQGLLTGAPLRNLPVAHIARLAAVPALRPAPPRPTPRSHSREIMP